jgi:hypothetical protein
MILVVVSWVRKFIFHSKKVIYIGIDGIWEQSAEGNI